MKILLTGAGGFVGTRFLEYNKNRFEITTISLRNDEWQGKNFAGFDAVVHLAGKAHEMSKIDDRIYFDINTELTKKLYQQASAAGVKHFVYISSVKVYGDFPKTVLNESSACLPNDAYGKSKLEAENFLLQQKGEQCTVAIVRPPLVYGPGVKGNMISLLRLCARNIPLPFKESGNRRSMVYIDNLVALINTIIEKKASGIFLAGDATPLSTGELVGLIRQAMNNKTRLFRLPGIAKTAIKKLRPALYTRLFGSYELNTADSFNRLSFTPPYTAELGIGEMVNWYLKTQQVK
jgi:nucleoside-diphosphate-sugar epimerase